MLNRDKKKYFTNAILGLIPFLVYLLIYFFTGYTILGLVVALALSAISEVSIRFYTKTTVCGLMFSVTFIAAFATLITRFLVHKQVHSDDVYPIFFEIYLVFIILTVRMFKPQINRHFFKKKSVMEKVFLNEFFQIVGTVQYLFTLHIFILLITKYIKGESATYSEVLYTWAPVIVILALMLYQALKIRTIATQLQKEEWLPIVNERGEVSGKIARSVSSKMKNKFLHPIVRVALIHDGKIYLQERKKTEILDPKKLDHPFEKYMLFNEDINLSARASIAQELNNEDLPFRFSLKYVFENDLTKRLVFLFIAKIEDESQVKNLQRLNGKFWSIKQIDENMNDPEMFSECFQLEYEYLKNTYFTIENARAAAEQRSLTPES